MTRNKIFIAIISLGALIMSACSTTSGIPDGEQLYTGMKPTEYSDFEDNKHFRNTKRGARYRSCHKAERLTPRQSYSQLAVPFRTVDMECVQPEQHKVEPMDS